MCTRQQTNALAPVVWNPGSLAHQINNLSNRSAINVKSIGKTDNIFFHETCLEWNTFLSSWFIVNLVFKQCKTLISPLSRSVLYFATKEYLSKTNFEENKY